MNAPDTLKTLRRGGYTATVVDGKLKLKGPRKPSEELEASLMKHRDEIIRLIVEGIIVDELEVFELADEFFSNKGKAGAA